MATRKPLKNQGTRVGYIEYSGTSSGFKYTKAKAPRRAEEDAEQELFAQYCDARRFMWFHVPNGGVRHVSTAVRLKRQGVKRGVPDNWILTEPPVRPGCKGVVCELKKAKGGRASREQLEWIAWLRNNGWYAFVADGAGEAIKVLRMLGL